MNVKFNKIVKTVFVSKEQKGWLSGEVKLLSYSISEVNDLRKTK